MKKILHILLFLIVSLFLFTLPTQAYSYERELERIAEKLVVAIGKAGKKNVATVDFSDLQGNTTELGRFIAEELSTTLVMSEKSFTIVDRTNLGYILAEQKLSITGLLNPKNAKKLGKIAGVDAIIIGNITPLGENIRLSIKVVSTDSANVIAAARGSIALTGAIQDMSERSIEINSFASTPSGQTSTGSSSVQMQPAKGKVNYKNKFIQARLKTVSRVGSNDGKISLVFYLENITKENMYLALHTNQDSVFMLDDNGVQWFRDKNAIGIATDKNSHRYCGSHKTLILPGQSIPVSLIFKPAEQSKAKNTTFSASLNGCVPKMKGLTKMVISIDGIRVPG